LRHGRDGFGAEVHAKAKRFSRVLTIADREGQRHESWAPEELTKLGELKRGPALNQAPDDEGGLQQPPDLRPAEKDKDDVT